MKVCKNCGEKIDSNSTFCNKCGTKIEENKSIDITYDKWIKILVFAFILIFVLALFRR